jgi:hypothetical protein
MVSGEKITFSVTEDMYFLMGIPFRGRALAVDLHLPWEDQLETMVARHCSILNLMSGSVIRIEATDEFLTECITTIVMRIYRSLGTQQITGGQLRVVEEVLYGKIFAWGVLMHTRMMSQLNQCWHADFSAFAFGFVSVAWFLERLPLLHPRILLEPSSWREPWLMRWAHVLAKHGGGEGGHYFTTMVARVWHHMPQVILLYPYVGMTIGRIRTWCYLLGRTQTREVRVVFVFILFW